MTSMRQNNQASSKARATRRKKTSREGTDLRSVAEAHAVTDYLSYRQYLQDLYQGVKSKNSSYSYMQFAQDLGLSKSNVIWLVISGRRRLTSGTLEKIIKSLKVRGVHRRYFEALIAYNNANRPDQRETLFKNLLGMKTQKLERSTQQDTLEYFAEWYHPIIRELVGLKSFSDDPEWIQKKLVFNVSPKQIKGSLDLLQKLGLIDHDEVTNRYRQTGGQISPDREVGKIAAVRYHQKICEIAKESITKVPSKRRDFNAMTLNLTEEAAMRLAERLYKVCEEVMAYETEVKEPDQVFQVNVQIFPFTK